ncbi:nucleolar protein 7 [Callorhinchus milii]|nr:nucleolar protein 7 [Callorhinchus milii]
MKDPVPDTTSGITTVQGEDQEAEEDDDNMENIIKPRMKGRYEAIRLKDQGETDQRTERAKAFINRRLYGPGRMRTNANEYYSLANKRDANKKGALQFVNKSWGKKQKEKARKLRKKWIKKHGIVPS